ncbi:MAG: VOC family protein [Opitutaceae bacterium]
MTSIFAKALSMVLCGAAAAALAAELPPLGDTLPNGERYPGKFVWADLFTPDPGAAQTFYTGLLGWQAKTIERTRGTHPHEYTVLYNAGEPVAGIAHRPWRLPGKARGQWIGYASVRDVAQALAAATSGGGRTLFPARNLPQRGTQAILIDPEGAELGLLHSSSGDPGEYTPEVGEWIWAELFARDPVAEGRFYGGVTGWEAIPDTQPARPDVLILTSGGFSRASVTPLPDRPRAKPGWLLLVRVADVKASAAKAASLGGRVLIAPGSTPTEYWRAVVADPTGAVIGLVQLAEPGQTEEGRP